MVAEGSQHTSCQDATANNIPLFQFRSSSEMEHLSDGAPCFIGIVNAATGGALFVYAGTNFDAPSLNTADGLRETVEFCKTMASNANTTRQCSR